MDVRLLPTDRLTPFWASLVARGCRVAVLDVPFAPVVQLSGLIQIDEWGAHDQVRGRLHVWPPALRKTVSEVTEAGGLHPFAAPHLSPEIPTDARELASLAAGCLSDLQRHANLALRIIENCAPDVLLAVFPEVHRASHYLWHTVDPAHPEFESRRAAGGSDRDLATIYRELDRQIGRLVEAAGPETTILIFSLHGMRPTRGIPGVLEPLLEHVGLLDCGDTMAAEDLHRLIVAAAPDGAAERAGASEGHAEPPTPELEFS